MRADRAAGITASTAGVVVALASTGIHTIHDDAMLTARFFPYLLSGILVAGGVILLVFPGHASLGNVGRRLLAQPAVLFSAAFLIYALAFPYVDFRVSTWLFMFVVMFILGSRRWLELLAVPTAVSLLTFYLFRYGFTVLLPTWT